MSAKQARETTAAEYLQKSVAAQMDRVYAAYGIKVSSDKSGAPRVKSKEGVRRGTTKKANR